jgi:phosphate transport system protein
VILVADKFHDELTVLRQDVVAMARFGRDMLNDAMTTLQLQDLEKAVEVKSRKTALSEQHDALEDRVFTMIALYQPVARDLRTLVCSLMIVQASERIGRYGKDIANVTRHLADSESTGNFISIPHMSELVVAMIDDAILAYEHEDLSAIREMSKRDDVVDSLRTSIFRECLTYMMEDPRTITRCTHYVMVSRFLERSGDYACKMAEKVHYMVTGERIEIK